MAMEPDRWIPLRDPSWDDFDDSERFGESEWSDQESICNNWRGFKQNNSRDSAKTTKNELYSLGELASRTIARNIDFGTVEKFHPRVPQELQQRIAFWSFPDDEEDIRLYTCLANGNGEEYQKGEILLNQKCITGMLQVGFHLSAEVSDIYKVAIMFDRQRITSCSCTCESQVLWCQHIVAVCLTRISQPEQACLRAPVSESLHGLNKDQLEKFALYLIHEFPQQILPTAQKLLDDLGSKESSINTNPGIPDPTAGASVSESTSWCLDTSHIRVDIKKILNKQWTNLSTVCDVNHLNSTAHPVASEYCQLLRSLRGKEPEGLYNLLSIVRELLRKRDKNSIPVLEIITEELLACDRMVIWWFRTKVSQYSGLEGHGLASLKNGDSSANQLACSNFCDEVVMLWRLAALNPTFTPDDRQVIYEKIHDYHVSTLNKLDQTDEMERDLERNSVDIFPGFKPCLQACLIDWTDNTNLSTLGLSCIAGEKEVATKEQPNISSSKIDDEFNIYYPKEVEDGSDLIKNVKKSKKSRKTKKPRKSLEDTLKEIGLSKKELNDNLEILFLKAEGLRAHGFLAEACSKSEELARQFLKIFDKSTIESFHLSKFDSKLSRKDQMQAMSLLDSDMLNKVFFLCSVLMENINHKHLAFRIAIFGLELNRKPAYTRAVEVKLINQQQDLLDLIKKIPLTSEELNLLRIKSTEIGQKGYACGSLTPLMLADYTFEAFVLSQSEHPDSFIRVTDHLPSDVSLGFEAAIAAIGYKRKVNETEHPILCEGIRRLRGDLAMKLLVHHKNDKPKLDLILEKLLDKDESIDSIATTLKNLKVEATNGKSPPRRLPLINKPSEASAHYMFDLAKAVFQKAGGNTASADIFHPNIVGIPNNRNVHRGLHMSSLKIALYALGIHNRTSSNWMSRTYSSHVTWIIAQALDIGLEAVTFLCGTWRGYLTPIEAADLGDRIGQQRDVEVQRIAAELALSYLEYSYALGLSEVKKALMQCQEQSSNMFEEALRAVENSSMIGEVSSDILFEVAKKWYLMYKETTVETRTPKAEISSDSGFNEPQSINNIVALPQWNLGTDENQSSSFHSFTGYPIAQNHRIADGQEGTFYIDGLRPLICPNRMHNSSNSITRAPLINTPPRTIQYCPSATLSQAPFNYRSSVCQPRMMSMNSSYYHPSQSNKVLFVLDQHQQQQHQQYQHHQYHQHYQHHQYHQHYQQHQTLQPLQLHQQHQRPQQYQRPQRNQQPQRPQQPQRHQRYQQHQRQQQHQPLQPLQSLQSHQQHQQHQQYQQYQQHQRHQPYQPHQLNQPYQPHQLHQPNPSHQSTPQHQQTIHYRMGMPPFNANHLDHWQTVPQFVVPPATLAAPVKPATPATNTSIHTEHLGNESNQNPNQSICSQYQTSVDSLQLNQHQLGYLQSSFRVGMKAMKMMNLGQESKNKIIKRYHTNEKFKEEVNRLLETSKLLGSSTIQEFIHCAIKIISSPIVLADIIEYLNRSDCNLTDTLKPELMKLVQRCQEVFIPYTTYKMKCFQLETDGQILLERAKPIFDMTSDGKARFAQMEKQLRTSLRKLFKYLEKDQQDTDDGFSQRIET